MTLAPNLKTFFRGLLNSNTLIEFSLPFSSEKSDLISMSFVGAVLPLYMLLSDLLHELSMLILKTADLGDFIIVFLSPF